MGIFSRMFQFSEEADQTAEAAKATVCPLQRDVEQLKRDVGEIWAILKQPKRRVVREVNEMQQPSQTHTGASIVSHSSQCFTYAGMFGDCYSISNNNTALTCLLAHRTTADNSLR